MIIHEKAEVVIVGSGAAGSVYASELAKAGKDVLILEKGKSRGLNDLFSSQIWARRLKWGAPHVEEEGDSISFNFNAGHGYGGAAMHHYGVWPRYHPEDFKMFSQYGEGLDWPFEYDDLRPYYDRVQDDVGLAGDASAEIWRPQGAPYPMPPVLVTEHGLTLAKGFKALGMHTSPLPMAIVTEEYKGRAPCIWDGWCDAGCPIGSLANPLVTYLKWALDKGAKIRSECNVSRVITDSAGEKATGVEYIDGNGELNFQPADVVVLAAFAVENPRILLNSANDKHPAGLANSSGLVGRYLMSHPSVSIYGTFAHDMQNYVGATGGQLLNQDHFDKKSTPGTFGSRQWEIGLILKPNDLLGVAMSKPGIYGKSLDQFMRQGTRGMGSMVAVCEDLPNFNNKVSLSTNKDENGVPLAKVTYKVSEYAKKLIAAARKEGVAIFKAAGAKDAWSGPQGGQHIMGGAIMGNDERKSVTNQYGRSHDIPNLVIGGTSTFVTASCVNSTFTLHALALKSSEHMIRDWGDML